MTPAATTLRNTLVAGATCLAALIVVAPGTAQAESSSGWFGGRTTTGSGTVVAQPRAVADFQAITVSGSIQVQVRQSGREAVEVRTDDNLQALLETVVESSSHGRTLHVRWKRGESVRTRTDPVVSVDVIKLSAISSSGSGSFSVESLTTPRLAVSIAGSGDALLKALTADELSVSVAGSGDVRAAGKADKLKVGIAGSGDVRLLDLAADEVRVSIAGSGDAAVRAEKTLDISIAGSGDVVYAGAATVKSSVAGSGNIRQRR